MSEEFSGDLLKLVKEKGVYPYEYMDSFKKFPGNKLPDRCKFFSSLKDKCISEKDYLKANNIWNVFKMKTMGDYHVLYLNRDVLLLADVFEKFIRTCLDYFGLDPCHYFSSPGLNWDAMLKMTGIELELISDIGMHLFIEKGMSGAISYIAKRHDLRNDYPLAPEKLEISQNMLSKYCFNIANKYGIKIGGVNKLVPNLDNKSQYVVQYRNIHLYLSLGMELSKVHKILKFKQSDWLKKYIDFKTDKRKNAANSFEKNYFELMNNSVFGKTMENLRKRVSAKLVNNAKVYVKCISKPIFVSQKIFSKNCVAIHEINPVLTLNK